MKLTAANLFSIPGFPKKDSQKNPALRVRHHIDSTLLLSSLFLVLSGIVMVYSASIAVAGKTSIGNFQPEYFLTKHLIFISAGLLVAVLAFQIKVDFWEKISLPLFTFGLLLLIVVLIPGVGKSVNGSQRWITIGPINFQPSELMKLFAIFYSADFILRKQEYTKNLKQSFLPIFIAIMLAGGLLLMEPDFGAFAIITFLSLSILFMGGVSLMGFFWIILASGIGFALLIFLSPYRWARIVGFSDPWQDPFGKGYQLSHSLIAFGRGELWGVGLGGSVEKLFYLPEAHTDFLMAVLGEEFGFIGVCAVVIAFFAILHRSFAIGKESESIGLFYHALVAKGIGLWFGIQSFVNMGVNMGILPTKGLTLPLMSYGGSSIVASFIALAILFRIHYENGITPPRNLNLKKRI